MVTRTKYPRTMHLPWSLGATNDDKILDSLKHFEGMSIVITEKMDGENCVDASTIVDTEDGEKTIKWICENKYNGKAVSLDVDEDNVVLNDICGWSIQDETEDWYEVELENGSVLYITEEDYVWLPKLNCYRKVKDLKKNDEVFYREGVK